MKTHADNNFVVRQYGKAELALLYFPHLTPQSAWRKQCRWIMLNPVLCEALVGYQLKTLTPK